MSDHEQGADPCSRVSALAVGERHVHVQDDEKPIINEGELFAAVGGARLYQYSPCMWLDCIAGIEEEGFDAQFEKIPLEEVIKHSGEDIPSERRGEAMMRRALNEAYTFVMEGRHPIELPEEFREA